MNATSGKNSLCRSLEFAGKRGRTIHPVALAFIATTLATCLIVAASPALATTTVWTGSSAGGVFNDDANWDQNSPGDNPTPADDLGIFNNTTNVNGTITFDADATHFNTFVLNTSGAITFNTAPFKWTMTNFFLAGSTAGEVNTIQLVGGSLQAGTTLLGNVVGSDNNSIEVTGAGTLWHSTATGAALRIGAGGSANSTFTVHNGAKVTTAGQTILGLAGSDNGRLFVTDTGVLETANYLGIGHTSSVPAGNAVNNEAHILNGGTVKALRVLMGIAVGANDNRLLVSGAGSTVTLTGIGTTTQLGNAATFNNIIEITSGGAVLGSNRFRVGPVAGSTGNKLIINDGTLVGTSIDAFRGDVTITKGDVTLNDYFGAMEMAFINGILSATEVGTSSITFNSGIVRAVRSNLNNGLLFTVGDGGADSATYQMKKTSDNLNATHTFANGLFLNSNAILEGNGNIAGNVSAALGAQVNVGLSPGLINVAGNWDNTGMSLGMEIGDLSASTTPGVGYDLLDIAGAFTHGGSVVVDLSSFVSAINEVKVIGWLSEVGSSASTAVSFIGGSPRGHEFRSDGLYITGVPEPNTLVIGIAGLLIVLSWRRTAK